MKDDAGARLEELIARLEGASGPSRELDDDIGLALDWADPKRRVHVIAYAGVSQYDALSPGGSRNPQADEWLYRAVKNNSDRSKYPHFTGSIDTALTLGRTPDEQWDILETVLCAFQVKDTTLVQAICAGCAYALKARAAALKVSP